MQKGFSMFYLNAQHPTNRNTKHQDSNLIKISILQKLLKKNQDENQRHKANIQKLLEQHKKLLSLTKTLIQTLETESLPDEKQVFIKKQIRLFKQSMNF